MWLLVIGVLSPTNVAAQEDTLASARALYTSAEYEAALATLNRMRGSALPAEDYPAVEQYRALCLLALGRATEAEDAIEAVVTAVPSFAPSEAEVSPRVRSAFSEVRRRVLPSVIQRKYAEAKAAFDRKDHTVSLAAFGELLAMMQERDVEPMIDASPLADLRTLAQGFRDLSATALAAAAAAAAPPPPAAPAPVPDPPAAPSEVRRIYSSGESQVVDPVVISQELPPFRGRPMFATQGVIEVIVDEQGAVESASILTPIGQAYDVLALHAARTWRYKPATVNGTPVKYRKLVQVKIQK
ncbi:MAG: energy transducer TonB [Acidobacteriota bacterium]